MTKNSDGQHAGKKSGGGMKKSEKFHGVGFFFFALMVSA